jgi:hypothetical protein
MSFCPHDTINNEIVKTKMMCRIVKGFGFEL